MYYSSDILLEDQMRTVGAREANQQFARLLREAENGHEITITRNGKKVARLIPARLRPNTQARKKAIAEMMRLLEEGLPVGGRGFTRDEMHED
jgi:prevent-host-death family protein